MKTCLVIQPKSISPYGLRGQGSERYRLEFTEVNFPTNVRIDPTDLDFRFFDESKALLSRDGSKHRTYRNGGIRRHRNEWRLRQVRPHDFRPPSLFSDACLTTTKQRPALKNGASVFVIDESDSQTEMPAAEL